MYMIVNDSELWEVESPFNRVRELGYAFKDKEVKEPYAFMDFLKEHGINAKYLCSVSEISYVDIASVMRFVE